MEDDYGSRSYRSESPRDHYDKGSHRSGSLRSARSEEQSELTWSELNEPPRQPALVMDRPSESERGWNSEEDRRRSDADYMTYESRSALESGEGRARRGARDRYAQAHEDREQESRSITPSEELSVTVPCTPAMPALARPQSSRRPLPPAEPPALPCARARQDWEMSGPESERAVGVEARRRGGSDGGGGDVGLVDGDAALERWRAYLWGLGWQARARRKYINAHICACIYSGACT